MANSKNTVWYVLGAAAVAAVGYGVYRSRKGKGKSAPKQVATSSGTAVNQLTAPAPSDLPKAVYARERLRAAKNKERYFVLVDEKGKERCFETRSGNAVDLTECLKEGSPALLEGVGGSLGHNGLGVLGGGF